MSTVRVPHPIEVLYGHGVSLACDRDGELRADELHGLFAGDTRMLSTYRMTVGGQRWQLLSRQLLGRATAQWRFQSPELRDPRGTLAEGSLFLELDRHVAGALHDDLRVTNYAGRTVRATLALQLDTDFADILEVREGNVPPRLAIGRIPRPDGVTVTYSKGDFDRRLHAAIAGGSVPPQVVGSLFLFDVALEQGETWRICLDVEPELDGDVLRFVGDPHARERTPAEDELRPTLGAAPVLQAPFDRGCADLRGLSLARNGAPPYVAAGAPWFYTLFGRDSLVPALMAGLVGDWIARGALHALSALQATTRDDWRDAEPGKLPHEVRRGELARFDRIPHACYYGSHDAPSLYCLTLWSAWRWTGDRALLDAHLPAARAALRWCEELGDRDGDGVQEYATRSRQGYYNQSWKDAGDAILYEDGSPAELPLATVELQGYLYAARLAMAELLEVAGDSGEAARQRSAARALQALVEERYWIDAEGFYAVALDGRKRPVRSIASNAGHLLWCGLPAPERASAVSERMLEPDLFTGWGVRTLSSGHARYNPLSYQRGSVWPHDTAIAAAGMWRYGMREHAATLLRALLDAAAAFEDDGLPELFCGFDRSLGSPVPYREANVPQAWAAAAPTLAAQLFLGLVPDAPRGRCFVDPWLPEWLPSLELRGVAIGGRAVDVAVAGEGDDATLTEWRGSGIELVEGETSAVLYGTPLGARTGRASP